MPSSYKTALVTGAGSGMGRAIAETLARSGLRVALVGRDRAKLDAVKAGLDPESAARVTVEPGDVADRPAIGEIVDRTLKAFGSIDVLVCNAGTNVRNRSSTCLDPADWDLDDRHEPDRGLQPRPFRAAVDERAEEGAGDPGLLDLGRPRQPPRRRRLLGLEVRPGGAGDRPGPRGPRPGHPLDRDLSRRGQHADPGQPPRPGLRPSARPPSSSPRTWPPPSSSSSSCPSGRTCRSWSSPRRWTSFSDRIRTLLVSIPHQGRSDSAPRATSRRS